MSAFAERSAAATMRWACMALGKPGEVAESGKAVASGVLHFPRPARLQQPLPGIDQGHCPAARVQTSAEHRGPFRLEENSGVEGCVLPDILSATRTCSLRHLCYLKS